MNKLQVGIFGRTNSGKSTLFNTLIGEDFAIVSPVKGTTTDAVSKATEIEGLGAINVYDTAGFDDATTLGERRVQSTLNVLDKVDLAILVVGEASREDTALELDWIAKFEKKKLPYIVIYNRYGNSSSIDFCSVFNNCLCIDCADKSIERRVKKAIKQLLIHKVQPLLFDGLVSRGDTVLLVMPQDSSAPSDRLILPQSMSIKELTEHGVVSIVCDLTNFEDTYNKYQKDISLVVADSSVFAKLYPVCKSSKITSFSVLFAKVKGDINVLVDGANAIDNLTENSKVLIVEACSHSVGHEDIGTVKIPKLLKQKVGEELQVDFVRAINTMADLADYDLVIHCGGCMISARSMASRIDSALENGVKITNYGVAIAKLTGILDKVVY